MADRMPIIYVDGRLQPLPAGDRIPSSLISQAVASTDPLWSSTRLILPCDGFSNGDKPTGIDKSSNAFTPSYIGSTSISTAQKWKGDGSLYIPSGGGISFANSSAWAFGSGNFTLETGIYTDSSALSAILFAKHQALGGTGPFVVELVNGLIYCFFNNSQYFGYPLPTGEWVHIAVVRHGAALQLWMFGQIVASTYYTSSIGSDSNPLYIGSNSNAVLYLDSPRVTAAARYNAPFDQEGLAFPLA